MQMGLCVLVMMAIQEDHQGEWNYSVLIIIAALRMALNSSFYDSYVLPQTSFSFLFIVTSKYITFSHKPATRWYAGAVGIWFVGWKQPVCRALGEKGKQNTYRK